MLDATLRQAVETDMKLAFLLPLVASAALAQPFVSSPEITAPMERSRFDTRITAAMALAHDGNGFVAAWSAGSSPSRIFAARLNGSFQPIGAVREIPTYQGDAFDANYPDIAPVDGGYALVWLERERSAMMQPARLILRRFSPAFEPLEPAAVAFTPDTSFARVVPGAGGALSILVKPGFAYTIDAHGVTNLVNIGDISDDVVAPPGVPIAGTGVEFKPPQASYYTWCGWPCPLTSPHWQIKAQVGNTLLGTTFDQEIARSGIGFGGGLYVVAWFDNLSKAPGFVRASRIRASDGEMLDIFARSRTLGTFNPFSTPSRPSIAWDGERFLIAWASDGDIAGASMTPDGRVDTFTLAATAADERAPLVVGVMPGRFALAYEIRIDDQHRQLAMRYVDFKVFSRRHASR